MASEAVRGIVAGFLKRAREAGIPVLGAILYGSHARGDARPDSDIDVLVLVEDGIDSQRLEEVRRQLLHLLWDSDTRIEPRAVRASTFAEDQASPLIEIAREEGIYIAA
jgi:uncharacterized protein